MEQGTQGSIVLRRNGNGESQGEEERVVDLSGQVHLLPCSIKFNGPSSVSQYFKPKSTAEGIESEGLRTQEAYFRGRKLQGASIPIPDGYSGFVLGKKSLGKRKASDNSDGSSNCWEMNAKYKSITYWNHDSLPSQDDAFLRCFHWLSVAKSIFVYGCRCTNQQHPEIWFLHQLHWKR
ncbi:uncharacterized protein LOC126585371 isoform X1 [Malus sylvestris]|uniref:uncharacterized protein LOC126585371 isoform X1 n=1 Tax=Malus sylvestris TaxID=3752 RepID=UPI0021AC21ED|nr:uncharacterized protein LOC126585371 isoform X1 [Malus sylvestris]